MCDCSVITLAWIRNFTLACSLFGPYHPTCPLCPQECSLLPNPVRWMKKKNDKKNIHLSKYHFSYISTFITYAYANNKDVRIFGCLPFLSTSVKYATHLWVILHSNKLSGTCNIFVADLSHEPKRRHILILSLPTNTLCKEMQTWNFSDYVYLEYTEH